MVVPKPMTVMYWGLHGGPPSLQKPVCGLRVARIAVMRSASCQANNRKSLITPSKLQTPNHKLEAFLHPRLHSCGVLEQHLTREGGHAEIPLNNLIVVTYIITYTTRCKKCRP